MMTVRRERRFCAYLVGFMVAAVLGGCASAGSDPASSAAVLAHGRTAAGADFVATIEPTKECPLEVAVMENGVGTSKACYSILEAPARPKIECLAGRLIIHLQVTSATQKVRLNMSNGQTVTSRVIAVPRRLGGPASLYYQAVMGPSPLPVSLTELGEDQKPLQTLAIRRIQECAPDLVKRAGPPEHVLARVQTPDGTTLSISNSDERILGRLYRGLRVVLDETPPKEIGVGALRFTPPLRWGARRVCNGATPFTVIYGVLENQRDHAVARVGGKPQTLSHTMLPATTGWHGQLVYGIWGEIPEELTVKTPAGKTAETIEEVDQIAKLACVT
jgi:hypothetical protein